MTIVDDDTCRGLNLIRNGGADELPLINGEIPGWIEVSGFAWTYDRRAHSAPYSFWPACTSGTVELRQDVDLRGFTEFMSRGLRFRFEGWMATWNQIRTRIRVEYLDATKQQLLAAYDTGDVSSGEWWRASDLRALPVGTAWARIRLMSTAPSCWNDGFLDTLSLVPMGFPSLVAGDSQVVEGSAGPRTAAVPVRLSCGASVPVEVDYLTSDGTATSPGDYQATVGTLVFQPGETSKDVMVPVMGDTLTEGNETFLLSLVSPENAGIADAQGIATILEDEVWISIADVSLVEGDSGVRQAVFPLTLSGPIDQPVTVEYQTEASTATAGSDFAPIAGRLTFAPGQTAKTLAVDVVTDTAPEPDEKFKLNLHGPVNATIMRGQATATIVTDDLGITVGDAAVVEGNAGTVAATFTVRLNAASTVAVSVGYATRAASAMAGSDFTATAGTLTFQPGETTKTIGVSVLGDSQQEAGETFYLDLSNPVNATLVDGEGLGVIGDDDGCPGPNLLRNPGAEEPLVVEDPNANEPLNATEIPEWVEAAGQTWTYNNWEGPFAGTGFFYAGGVGAGELRQDVDLAAYAAFIDAGIQRFYFEGHLRSARETPPDTGQILVEYLDAERNRLTLFDSGGIADAGPWRSVSDLRLVPPGTRWARVRLLATRQAGPNADAYFDEITLRSLDTPVVSAADISIPEGDFESVVGSFAVAATCASGRGPISIGYETADGTATSPSDYAAASGTIQLDAEALTQPVEVTVAGDFRGEIREAFALRLTNPVNAVVLDPEALGTIRDADPAMPPVAGSDVVYTFDADFDLGSVFAVDHDAPNQDQLQVGARGGSFPYLWVAASARGSIVKIETRTGEVLGEYATSPDAGVANGNPSRTTVALDGSVWVGNRADGSVLHVGLPELGQCIDRNGNGTIDTSNGYGDVRPWPGSANLGGGVTAAQDECILHYVKVSAAAVRHVSVERDNNVWVSGYEGLNSGVFNLIHGETGEILRTESNAGCGGYGGLVDRNGVIWSSSLTGRLLRWDPNVNPPTPESRRCLAVHPYGLAIDSQGNIWGSEYLGAVWKISPDGNTISGPYSRATSFAQGLAVDGQDHVWVTSSQQVPATVVSHLLPDGRFLGSVVNVPLGSTGLAIDSDGKIWAANLQASNVARIDPALGPVGSDGATPLGKVDLKVPLPGAYPYNYSDMTGFVALRNTAAFGRWLVIQDGGAPGVEWGMIRWNLESEGQVPAGSRIVIEARAADLVPALGSRAYAPITNGVPFEMQGRYVQVRVTLERNAEGVSPVLSDLRIQAAQDGTISVADVTVTEGDTGTRDALFGVTLAQPVNRDVSMSYTTVDGAARAGEDYGAVSGAVTIPYGATAATVTVPVVGDTLAEPDESFSLRLSEPVHGVLARGDGTATVIDDDRVPLLVATKIDSLEVDGDGDSQAGPGDELGYEIVLRNEGLASATAVALEDAPPANTQIVGGSVTTTAGTVESSSPVRVAIGDLAAGSSVTVRFRVRLDPAMPPEVTDVSNQARVNATDLAEVLTDDPGTPVAGDATVTSVVNRPNLQAVKVDSLTEDRDGDGVPSPGDILGYEITVRNVSGRAATEVVLRDRVPEHTSMVPGSPSTTRGGVVSEDPVEIEIGTLAVGETATIRFAVAVESPVPLGVTEISNQGVVLSAELPALHTDDPTLAGATDPTVTSIAAVPRLVAEKTAELANDGDGDGTPSPGDELTYTVRVLNVGNTSAAEVRLIDPIPTHTQLVAGSVVSSGGAVLGENPVEVELGEIAGAASMTVSLRVRIDDPIAAGVARIENQGTVTSDNLPELLTDDPSVGGIADPTVTAVSAAPLLGAEKTASLLDDVDGSGFVSPGDVLLYRVRLSNSGNTSATGVLFLDSVPTHAALVSGSIQPSQGTVVSESPIQVDLGDLPADSGAEITFNVAIDAEFPLSQAAIANQGSLSSREVAEVLTDDPATPETADPTRTEVAIPTTLSIGDVSAAEGDGAALFPLSMSRPTNHPVTVHYATANGTALSGEDYIGLAGTFTIPAGTSTSSLLVEVVSDRLDEAEETFRVDLSDPVIASISDGQALGTIRDDDDPPLVTIADVTVEEGDTGTTEAVFVVALSTPSALEVRMSFATADGTALQPADYLSRSGNLVFAPGVVTQNVSVQIVGDTADEADETFNVKLANLQNGLPGDVEAIGSILDDEDPTLTIEDVSVTEGDSGTTDAVFSIHLTSPAAQSVSVHYATVGDTAESGADFEPISGVVSFPAGQTDRMLAVKVKGDLVLETDEVFRVELSNASGAGIDDGVAVGTILDDEACPSPNLLANAGAEERPAAGEIPSWREIEGLQWLPQGIAPVPFEGLSSFGSGVVQYGELRQDIDLTPYAPRIDAGGQRFSFSARLQSFDETPPDVGRIVVEYRDAANEVALEIFDSGEVASVVGWTELTDIRMVPAGTRWARVRLLTTRFTLGANDSYFDALTLRALGIGAVSIDDVRIAEGDAGVRDAVFTIRLACPIATDTRIDYVTSDGTATAGQDYQSTAGQASIPAASASAQVRVPVYGDALDEPAETFFVDLSLAAGNGVVVADPRGEGTIWNDDWCQRTPGYWKNHRQAWPVTELQIGGVWYYEAEIMSLLQYGGAEPATRLARHLAATLLNLERGADPSLGVSTSILSTVESANLFLAAHPPGSNPAEPLLSEANALKNALDAYNNACPNP